MNVVRWITLIVAWLLWITYSKEYVTPIAQENFGETLGYIAASAVTFIGGWAMWRMILKH